MQYETAAEAFEGLQKLIATVQGNNLVWIANAAANHFKDRVLESQNEIIRVEKFGIAADRLRAYSRLNENKKCLEISETIREWLVLCDAESSAPAMVKAVMDMHRRPDIDVTTGDQGSS